MWEPIYEEQILEVLLGEKGLREIGGWGMLGCVDGHHLSMKQWGLNRAVEA